MVVPAYNEEDLIGKILSTMPAYIDKIIVVDDYSKDTTFNVAKSFSKKMGAKLIKCKKRS